MRLLHLSWPHLHLRLARARHERTSSAPFPPGPLILGGQPWADGSVLDADEGARALGVVRGMALGHAHRLVPEATFLDPVPAADREAVEAALDCLAQFSPSVGGTSDPFAPSFGVLEAQADGLERLWGAEPVLVDRIGRALSAVLPGMPRAGVAGTRFAAALAARGGGHSGVTIVPAGDDAAFLAPLPAAALSRDPEVRARLERFGLRRIGAVAVLPRSALVARFGQEGARIHARANGLETDPFRPRRASAPLALGLQVDPPVAELDALRFVLHRLAGALVDQVRARGAATGRARLTLILDATFSRRDTPGSIVLDQALPEPTAEGEAVERLLLARLEQVMLPAPVGRLELELAEIVTATGQQLALFVPQAARLGRLTWQLARLAIGYGADRVGRVSLVDPDALLPEHRWAWSPAAIEPGAIEPGAIDGASSDPGAIDRGLADARGANARAIDPAVEVRR